MSGTTIALTPVKCATCDALARSPLTCTDCRSLYEHVQGADYFELFGLPRSFDLDAAILEQRYLSITRNVHPDAFAVAEPEMQMLAMRLSAAVNRAHETLRDPLVRAGYLLESVGGKSAAEDKRVAQELLNRMLLLREEVEEARAAGDHATLSSIKRSVLDERAAAANQIAALARQLNDGGEQARDALRMQLNGVKYLDALLAQL